MSYIQINIGTERVTEAGQPAHNLRGLKFNQLAIEILSTHNDDTASALTYAMVYGGLRGNSYVKREEPDYTFEQVCDWVDALPNRVEVIASISKCLAETQLWKDLIEDGKKTLESKDKKKAAKKKT